MNQRFSVKNKYLFFLILLSMFLVSIFILANITTLSAQENNADTDILQFRDNNYTRNLVLFYNILILTLLLNTMLLWLNFYSRINGYFFILDQLFRQTIHIRPPPSAQFL